MNNKQMLTKVVKDLNTFKASLTDEQSVGLAIAIAYVQTQIVALQDKETAQRNAHTPRSAGKCVISPISIYEKSDEGGSLYIVAYKGNIYRNAHNETPADDGWKAVFTNSRSPLFLANYAENSNSEWLKALMREITHREIA